MTDVVVTSGITSNGITLSANDTLSVSSGGTALATTVSSGATLYTYVGGVDSGTDIATYGTEYVLAGGTSIDAAATASFADLLVNSGGTASGATLTYGFLYIDSSGSASSAVLSAGGLVVVASGGVLTGAEALAGGIINVSAGGEANDASLVNASVETISSGGTANGTIVGSGGQLILSAGAVASGVTLQSGGTLTVASGASATGLILDDVNFTVSSGTVASASIISSGGTLILNAGATDQGTVIQSGGTEWASQGGIASGASVRIDGQQAVLSGGTALATVLSGTNASQIVYSGGIAIGSLVSGGYIGVLSGGVVSNAILSDGGLYMSSGALASGITVLGASTVSVSASVLNGATLSNGTLSANAGAWVADIVLSSGASLLAMSGATAVDTDVTPMGTASISSGAVELVSGGSATGVTILNGGLELVAANAVVSGSLVSSGGSVQVQSGGTDQRSYLDDGGTESLASGAVLTSAQVNSGATLTVSSGAIASNTTLMSGGTETVLAGGSVYNAVVGSGAVLSSVSGATISGATISSGGTLLLTQGAVSIGSQILAGGTEIILSGSRETSVTAISGAVDQSGVNWAGTSFHVQYVNVSADISTLAASSIDTLITDTSDLSDAQIQTLETQPDGSSRAVLSYLSTTEVAPWMGNLWTVANSAGILEAADPNTTGAYYVDITNAAWQAAVVQQAVQIANTGVDGLFLDTVDYWSLLTGDPAANKAAIESLVIQIAQATRAINPNFKLVGNNDSELADEDSAYAAVMNGHMREDAPLTASDIDQAAAGSTIFVEDTSASSISEYQGAPGYLYENLTDNTYSLLPMSGASQSTNGGTVVIGSGGQLSGGTVSSGGSVQIGSGGTAYDLSIGNSGFVSISAGGALLTATLSGAAQLAIGADTLVSAVSASAGGTIIVSSGGTANNDQLLSGGVEIISGGGTDLGAAIGSGGTLVVQSGGIAPFGTIGSGGTERVSGGGIDSGSIVQSGGVLTVLSGGVVQAETILSGGVLLLSAGAVASGTILSTGAIETVGSGALATSAQIDSGSVLTLTSGGTAAGSIILASGSIVVANGGIVSGSTIGAGASVDIEAGGLGFYTSLLAGGTETLESGASLTSGQIGSGAALTASAGAVLQAVSVSSGGTLTVLSGATEVGLTLSSGALLRSFGGAVGSAGATIAAGGATIETTVGATIAGTLNIGTFGTTLETDSTTNNLTGGITGAGTLVLSGGGTAVLSGSATGTTIAIDAATTLDFQTQSGPAAIQFDGSSATLIVETSALSGGTIAASLSGFDAADQIDLAGFTGATSAVLSGGVLQISDASADHVSLSMTDNQGSTFAVASDGHGGTIVTVSNPYVTAISATPSKSGPLDAGATVLFTVTPSNAITVNASGGTPYLTLSDGGEAQYVGTGAQNDLLFEYTVAAGDNTSDLTVAGLNANGASLTDTNSLALSGAGIASLSGSVTGLQIDTIAPNAPAALALDSPYAASNTATPIITGTAEAGSDITLYRTDLNTAVGTAIVGTNGTWQVTTHTLSDGTYGLYATAEDSAGNISAESTGLTVQIDTVAPTAPAFTVADGTDGVAQDDTPTLSGTAEAGSVVKIYDGSTTAIATVTTNGAGDWQTTLSALATGSHNLAVTATDEAGNVSVASSAESVIVMPDVTILFTAQLTDDTGSSATDGVTSDSALTGTAAPDSTVTIANGSTILATVTANTAGVWQYTPNLTDGTYMLTASGIGSQSNTASASVAMTLDTTPPTVTIGNVLTNESSPEISGTATADSIVMLTLDDQTPVSVVADSSGNWRYLFQSVLTDGAHTVQATATDIAGVSTTSAATGSVIVASTAVDGASSTNASIASSALSGQTAYQLQLSSGTASVTFLDGSLNVGNTTQAAYLTRLYEGVLGRAADSAGISFWANALAGGLMTEMQVAQYFLSSKEYAADHTTAQTNAQFVTSLYQGLLQRAPTTSERDSGVANLSAGTSRGQLLASIANSTGSQQALAADTGSVWIAQTQSALVSVIYEAALGRAADQTGLSFWTNQLQNGVTATEMMQSFASTAEYQANHRGQSVSALIESVYTNALGRVATDAEISSLTAQLQSGALTTAGLIVNVAQSSAAIAHINILSG